MSAESLQATLDGRGLRCRVEERDRMALLMPADEEALEGLLRAREAIADAGRVHGFTHVALEIPGTPSRAPLPGD